MKLSVHIDLSLCDVSSKVRNWMGDVWKHKNESNGQHSY